MFAENSCGERQRVPSRLLLPIPARHPMHDQLQLPDHADASLAVPNRYRGLLRRPRRWFGPEAAGLPLPSRLDELGIFGWMSSKGTTHREQPSRIVRRSESEHLASFSPTHLPTHASTRLGLLTLNSAESNQ
jgi:hypothetical protein